MKTTATRLMFLICLIALWPLEVRADWEKQMEIFGNGNTTMAVAAGTGKNAVAFGQNSQQGSASPALYVTKDGKTWNTAPPPGQFAFMTTLSMVDDKFVYGGGLGFFKSESGGQTFTEIKLPGTGGGPFDFTMIERVHAVDPVHVFAVSGKNVFWTPNSLQWEVTQATVDDVSLSTVYFINSTTGWVGGGKREEITEEDPFTGEEKVVGYNYLPKGIVMKTTDGGKSFVPLVIGANDYFRHLTFIDQNIGYAVAGNNDKEIFLKRTTDGGQSWVEQDLPAPPPDLEWMYLSRLVFTTPFQGWAAGAVGWPDSDIENMGNKAVILKTVDGGLNWTYDPQGEGQGAYLDIDFAGEHWGFAVGTFGTIMAYTDGHEWTPPDPVGDDVTEQPAGDAGIYADVHSWGNVFGVFGDEILIGENSYPGGTGGGLNVGTDDPECTSQTRSTGCRAGASGSNGGVALLLLLGACCTLLIRLRIRHVRRMCAPVEFSLLPVRCTQTSRNPIRNTLLGAAVLCGALALGGCGGEETVQVCEEVKKGKPPADQDTSAVDDAGAAIAPFHCGLTEGEAPSLFVPVPGRVNDVNNLMATVKTMPGGGSDLYLSNADGTNAIRLTEFDDPEVEVRNPSWSPDRSHLTFTSNFRARLNDKKQNVFIISLDRTSCYQVTPGIEQARIRDESALSATITGFFRYGQGAIANPVAGAEVGFPGAAEPSLTGSAGEFSIKVPPGTGKLVLRGSLNGMQVKGLAEYEVEEGELKELEPTIGFVEAEYTLGQLRWSHDGTRLYTFVTEQLETLAAIDINTGEQAAFLQTEEDRVVQFSPFPDAPLAVVAFNSDPEVCFVYALTEPPEAVHEFPFPGQTSQSVLAVSPMRFMATIQEDRVLLLGADPGGTLRTMDVTPDNLTGFVPGQLDWAPGGTKLAVTINTGGKTNILVIDVNSRESTALTTDGTSSQVVWYGK